MLKRNLPVQAQIILSAVVIVAGLLLAPATTLAFEPLPRATPESELIDPQILSDALRDAGSVDGLWAVVVVRNGKLVAEQHLHDQPENLHRVFSVTKSVMSTLIGIAVDRGFINSIDEPIVNYLPARLATDHPEKQSITIRHLLTMTAGFAWHETNNWLLWITSSDQAAWIMNRPLVSAPGGQYYYNTAASHLLSVVLSEATGIGTLEFADAYLFRPLGITTRFWEWDNQLVPFGGHGLWLRAEDMAKLGILFLQNGQWDGEQIVPAEWVSNAISTHVERNVSYGPLTAIDYGLLWWLDRNVRGGAFLAWGYGGQFVFCVPDLDLVVVTSSRGDVYGDAVGIQTRGVLHHLVDRILPAVRSRDYRQPGTSTPRRAPLRLLGDLENADSITVDPELLRPSRN